MKYFAKRKCHKNADTEIVSNVANVVNENSFLVCMCSHLLFYHSGSLQKTIEIHTCPVLFTVGFMRNILEHETKMNSSILAVRADQNIVEKLFGYFGATFEGAFFMGKKTCMISARYFF